MLGAVQDMGAQTYIDGGGVCTRVRTGVVFPSGGSVSAVWDPGLFPVL